MLENISNPVVIGITGASGVIIASQLVDEILSKNIPVVLTASSPSRLVWNGEMDESFGEALERWQFSGKFRFYNPGELGAPIASGTFPTRGMAIIPCSMSTTSAIASGLSDNLLRRAADVTLKEKRPLIIMPRETPLNDIHLSNMASLSRSGATILPADPPFYLKLKTLDEIVDFLVQRILVAMKINECLPMSMQYKGIGSD